jgi:hypothetical protein
LCDESVKFMVGHDMLLRCWGGTIVKTSSPVLCAFCFRWPSPVARGLLPSSSWRSVEAGSAYHHIQSMGRERGACPYYGPVGPMDHRCGAAIPAAGGGKSTRHALRST